jgi:hypothetical protein
MKSMNQQRHRLRFPDFLSLLLNPSVMMGGFFCLLAVEFEHAGRLRIVHALLAVAFTSLVPVGILFVLKAQGRLSDIEMRVRSERAFVYLICAAGYGIGAWLLYATGADWRLGGLLALHVPNTLFLIIFNRKLKVSIHAMVITSLYAAALMFFGMRAAPVGILVIAAAWARWSAGAHSIAELGCGMVIGGVLTPVEIVLLRRIMGG